MARADWNKIKTSNGREKYMEQQGANQISTAERLSAAVWALNAKTSSDDETLWLPLIFHLQDTAAVMEYLLSHWLPKRLPHLPPRKKSGCSPDFLNIFRLSVGICPML